MRRSPKTQKPALPGPDRKSTIIINTKNNLRAKTGQGETALAAAMRATMVRKAVAQ